MKNLSTIINEKINHLLIKYNGFFAFSEKQFEEAKKENGLMDALNKGFKSFGKDPKTPVDMESELMKALKGKGLK